MNGTTPIEVIRELIRSNLELAFDHLNNEDEAAALHELTAAIEKVSQIQQLKESGRSRLETVVQQQPLSIPVTNDTKQGSNR